MLIWIGSQLQQSMGVSDVALWTYSVEYWAFMIMSLGVVIFGLFWKESTKTIALAACFLTYLGLATSLSPLEGSLGRFTPELIAQVKDKDLWIPCDYRAKDEEYRLLLPQSRLHGYLASEAGELAKLTASYPLVLVQTPLGVKPKVCDSCQIMGHRMEMRARHTNDEIIEMLKGHFGQYLFVNEYLIASSVPNSAALLSAKDACR